MHTSEQSRSYFPESGYNGLRLSNFKRPDQTTGIRVWEQVEPNRMEQYELNFYPSTNARVRAVTGFRNKRGNKRDEWRSLSEEETEHLYTIVSRNKWVTR